MPEIRYVIGIDEAGRGPLAGPVSVGAVLVPAVFDWKVIPGVKDSKQLSAQKREAVFARMEELQAEGLLRFAVAFTPAKEIDTEGIVPAVRSALMRAIEALQAIPHECQVLLDGGLRAPVKFVNQITIIKGDTKEPAISLASIAAKVQRDRLMEKMADTYPHYQFDIHKGYGTLEHRKAIREFGLCEEHRKTFCRSFTPRQS
jgi:ribonuclease HII